MAGDLATLPWFPVQPQRSWSSSRTDKKRYGGDDDDDDDLDLSDMSDEGLDDDDSDGSGGEDEEDEEEAKPSKAPKQLSTSTLAELAGGAEDLVEDLELSGDEDD
ncbi:hypothetical protein CRUP_011125 [Coryphaenoides rupestris]|nr:hypothetical protein CRUP_011125 [Coryphaenoides rupestris]